MYKSETLGSNQDIVAFTRNEFSGVNKQDLSSERLVNANVSPASGRMELSNGRIKIHNASGKEPASRIMTILDAYPTIYLKKYLVIIFSFHFHILLLMISDWN